MTKRDILSVTICVAIGSVCFNYLAFSTWKKVAEDVKVILSDNADAVEAIHLGDWRITSSEQPDALMIFDANHFNFDSITYVTWRDHERGYTHLIYTFDASAITINADNGGGVVIDSKGKLLMEKHSLISSSK